MAKNRVTRPRASVYEHMIYTVFQGGKKSVQSKAIAFVSCPANKNVARIILGIGTELTGRFGSRVVLVDMHSIAEADWEAGCVPEDSYRQLADSDLWTITYERAFQRGRSFPDSSGLYRWSADPDFRSRFFREIRAKFDYILVDCGSLAGSSAMSSVAPIIDGVILVAGAGVTRRAQLEYARSLVRESGGRLLGSVLDGRTYPLPQWLHRLL
jgi:hypothetical protein